MNGPANDAGPPLTPLPARTGYVSLDRADAVIDAATEIKLHHYPLPDALRALGRLCLLHYRVDEKTVVTRLPRPDARQTAILSALGVHLPEMQM